MRRRINEFLILISILITIKRRIMAIKKMPLFFITIMAILMSLLTISPQFVSQASLANKNNLVSLNIANLQDACTNTACPSYAVKTDGADSDTNLELNDYALIYL